MERLGTKLDIPEYVNNRFFFRLLKPLNYPLYRLRLLHFLLDNLSNCKDSVVEWLERRACNSEAPSSSPTLTASWICSW